MLATRFAERRLIHRELATEFGVAPAAVSKYIGGESGGDDRLGDDLETIAIDTAELIADPLSVVSGRYSSIPPPIRSITQ